jgi:hypothetical protein
MHPRGHSDNGQPADRKGRPCARLEYDPAPFTNADGSCIRPVPTLIETPRLGVTRCDDGRFLT